MNKTEWAYSILRDRLRQGAYAPSQRLVLASLAKELGVSSVPVREALRRLEAEGWVIFRPNIGAEVRPIEAGQWVAVMDALAVIEARATALAAPHMTESDVDRARRQNEDMRAALERWDPLAASECNRAFHSILCERCPNHYLHSLVIQTWERLDAMRRTTFVSVPGRTRQAVDEHEHLLGLIAGGANEEAIQRYARDHRLRTVTAYLAAREAPDAAPPALGKRHALVTRALAEPPEPSPSVSYAASATER